MKPNLALQSLETRLVACEAKATRAEEAAADLRHKLSVAYVVAGALAVFGVTGGTILSNAWQKLSDLKDRTVALEATLSQWDAELAKSKKTVNEATIASLQEITRTADQARADTREQLSTLGNDQLARLTANGDEIISRVGKLASNQPMSKFQDGSTKLRVSSLEIIGRTGNVVASIGPGSGEIATELRLNDVLGNNRILQYVTSKGVPYTKFINTAGALTVWIGNYSNDNSGFVELYGSGGKTRFAKLGTEERGGYLGLYGKTGANISYLGPEQTTGNALLNLMRADGSGTKSVTPN